MCSWYHTPLSSFIVYYGTHGKLGIRWFLSHLGKEIVSLYPSCKCLFWTDSKWEWHNQACTNSCVRSPNIFMRTLHIFPLLYYCCWALFLPSFHFRVLLLIPFICLLYHSDLASFLPVLHIKIVLSDLFFQSNIHFVPLSCTLFSHIFISHPFYLYVPLSLLCPYPSKDRR
jgi:hypothetical protein